MTTELRQLDGNLQDVLESIAKHPNARLFRRDRDVVAATLRGERIVRHPTEPRLIAAERQLLLVHRASIALLLRRAAATALQEASAGDETVFFPKAPLGRVRWSQEAARAATAGNLLVPLSLLPTRGLSAEAVRCLAEHSLQFEDHAHAWSYVVCSFLTQSRPSRAHTTAERLLVRVWTPEDEHFLREHLACSQSELGRYASAAKNYLAAARLNPSNARSWCRALSHAFLAGDLDLVELCDQQLRELPGSVEAAFVVRRKLAGDHSSWPTSRLSEPDSTALEPRLGPAARSLIDAIRR